MGLGEWGLKQPLIQPFAESALTERTRAASLVAGGLAYRIFFWTIPLGVVLAAVASYVEDWHPGSLDNAARRFGISGVVASSATEAVTEGTHSRFYFLIIGVGLMGWFGIGVVRALRGVAALAWGIQIPRLARPLHASFAFSGIAFGSTAALSALGAFRRLGAVPEVLGFLLAIAGVTAVALGVMMLLPHPTHLGWRAFLPGALLISIGNLGIQLFVMFYLAAKLERSPAFYGSLGAASVILLWLYVIARLIVSAMFLNATLEHRRAHGG